MSQVEKIIPKKAFLDLLREGDQAHKKAQSASGSFGESVKSAVEHKNLHAGAFKLIARLNRMDEMKRNDFLRAFDIYSEMMDTEGPWAEGHRGDMLDAAPDPEAEARAVQQATEDQVKANEKRIKAGIKQKPEDEPAKARGAKKASGDVIGFPSADKPSTIN